MIYSYNLPHFYKTLDPLKPLIQEALIKPTLGLQTRLASTPSNPLSSKFGGTPYRPSRFIWPSNPEGRPLEFIGQINFSEIIAQTSSFLSPLPKQGIFQFYFDMKKKSVGRI